MKKTTSRARSFRFDQRKTYAPGIYGSSDNGQMACHDHIGRYGSNMPWRAMTDAEVAAMHSELADCKPIDESLCEICSRDARNARAKVRFADGSAS